MAKRKRTTRAPRNPRNPRDPLGLLNHAAQAAWPVMLADGGDGDEAFHLSTVASLAAGGGVEIDRAKGLIKNVAVMSIGPATGHGFEIDGKTLDTLIEAFEANRDRAVSRISHPERDFTGGTDGIEKLVAVPTELRRDGGVVRGDFRLIKARRKRFGDELLDLVEEVPERIGVSVVVGFDFEKVHDPQTGDVTAELGRVKWFKAADFVGEPAANRNGLLSGKRPDPRSGSAQEGKNDMDRIREFLLAKGLIQKSATDAQVSKALSKLRGRDRAVCALLSDDVLDDDGRAESLTLLGVQPDKPWEAIAPASEGEGEGGGTQLSGKGGTQTRAPEGGGVQGGGAAGGGVQFSAQHQAALDAAVAQRLEAEMTRQDEVRALAANHNLEDDFVADHIRRRSTIDQVREAALAKIGARMAPVGGLGSGAPSVTGGDDGRVSLCQGLVDAVLLSEGVELYEEAPGGGGELGGDPTRPARYVLDASGQPKRRAAHERAREFEGMSLVERGRRWLGALGVNTLGWDAENVAKTCLDKMRLAGHLGGVALAHSTSDFSGIFANVLNKTMLPRYEEEEATSDAWATTIEVKDFKAKRLNQMGQIPVPARVLEGAEYEYVTFGEKYESVQAFKYGLLLALTWEMFIDDDMGAFTQGAFGFAQSAKALEEDLIYAKLTGNPTLNEDSKAVFHTDHNNLSEGGAAALAQAPLAAARVAMRLQRGIAPKDGQNGRRLNLRPNVLLTPVELETDAEQLLASITELGQQNPNVPNLRFIRSLTPVSESRLSDDSTTAYYLVAGKRAAAPAGVKAKLRGYKTPTIERIANSSTSVDGVTYKLRHVFGAAIPDFRPWQKNAGA